MGQNRKTIGIVGAGVIGLSWASLYASHGHQIHIFDVREDIEALSKNPLRALIGHPFNPPHIIPLVEVCASENTPVNLVTQAMNFYKSLNKVAVKLNKPIEGFVANRLQTVIINEAIT